ncbi:MAG: TonB-dependent receptor [Dyadobacter sp.]|uniref:SusC/RagA family TonB-linked outer membrane protein n=1 Tax=Dyadobacter sp. TaxID=1914288 RepID=UPI001B01E9FE|nr:TonB-dependent receptor [Dyadobacter sp.]MBO9611398.1 TonB-dependent receptor [Dyadobacter sp.]
MRLTRLLPVPLLLNVWLGVLNPGVAQVLASAQLRIEKTPSKKQPATRALKDVLRELQAHYRVDIVFFDHSVNGLTVRADKVNYKAPLEKNISGILKPLGLTYKRTNDGGYMVMEKAPGEKAKINTYVVPSFFGVSNQRNLIYTASMALPAVKKVVVEKTITGQVTGDDGGALPGVSIVVKGTTHGTTADENGRYRLATTEDSPTLIFSFVGYTSREVVVGNQSVIDVRLSVDNKALDEVVIIGYGDSKREDLTGSVSSINVEKDLKNTPATRVDQMLQGRMAGVYIKSTNGAPGSPTTIRVRGSRSISATNEPIYVIDGIVDPSGTNLNSINPADIESIDVLKDASTTAIYGSRAANGVVLVTTKKGKAGRNDFRFSTSHGVSQLPRKLDLMHTREFAEFINEARIDAKMPIVYPNVDSIVNLRGERGTDWMNAVTRTAPFSTYDLSASGGASGDRGYTYFLSGNVLDQKGIIRNTGFQRYQGRLNFTKNLSSKVDLGINLNISREKRQITSIALGANSNWASSYLYLPPTMPVYKPDGSYETFNPIWYSGGHIDNPVAITDKVKNSQVANNVIGNFYLQYEPIRGLKLKSTLGINFINQRGDTYSPSDMPTKILNNAMYGSASSDIYNTTSLINENTANYSTSIGKHHIDFLIGNSYQSRKVDRLYASGGQLTNDITQYNNLGLTEQAYRGIASNLDENTIVSFLGRINYDYKKRYYLTLTGRRDGASNFAAGKKWGFFPSGAIKWRVSAEPFYETSRIKHFISDLSLRLTYGVSGNQGIVNYQSLASLNANSNSYIFGGTQALGYTQGNLMNDKLTWETTGQLDAGLDFELFNGRINLVADYYRMLSKNLLLTVQVPSQTGYSSRLVNLGKSLNEGFDFSISGDVIRRNDFSWNAVINISTNRQEVTDIGPLTKVALDAGFGYGVITSYLEKGIPIGANYGVEYAGTWKNQAEIDAELQKAAGNRTYVSAASFYKPGGPRYLDYNHDGVLNTVDYHYLAPANPKVYGGFGSTLSYKRLSLDFFFQFSQGHKMYNGQEFFMGTGAYLTNQFRYMVNRWSERNPDSDIPAVNSRDNIPTSRFLHDASMLRLKSAQISYNLGGLFLKKVIKDMRVYVSGSNLFLLTKYNGFDPEVNNGGGSSTIIAADNGSYPNARVATFGLNVSF